MFCEYIWLNVIVDEPFTNNLFFVFMLRTLALASGRQSKICERGISTSCVLFRAKVAARPKRTKYKTNAVSWEQINPAHYIFVRKGYLSYNTSNLWGETRNGQTAAEDLFIRKFMEGTWLFYLVSPIIIKRRANMIFLSAFFHLSGNPQQFYFLQGYTETILSYYLKCPVKLDLQTVNDPNDLVVTHV